MFHVLMLIFLGSMVGFCLSGDLFNLFVFFELMSVAAYALTAYKIEEEQALEGGINFAIVNSVAAFLILIGIALLYGRTGALNMAQIGRALATAPQDWLVGMAFVLISAGFLTKGALVPFHFWLSDAHAVAPTPVCVLFSGVMVELGLYGMARVYWVIFSGPMHGHAQAVQGLLLGMGAVSALVGGIMCFGQRHLKRLLAFSTIGHSGLFMIGVALFTPAALAGAGIYVLGHGLVKGALFMLSGILLNRFSSVDGNELHGRGREIPLIGVLFALGGLGLAGAWPFATGLGKGMIERAGGEAGRWWIMPLCIVVSGLTGGAVLRVTGRIFLGWGHRQNPKADTPKKEQPDVKHRQYRTPWVMIAPAGALLTLGLLLGFVPHLPMQAGRAAAGFMDRTAYTQRVLFNRQASTLPAPAISGWSADGVLAGAGSVGLALALAAVALFHKRKEEIDVVRRSVRQWAHWPMDWLRDWHNGQVVDYVTWLLVGVALMSAIMGWGMR
jgi:multicomponent Na+:H+ antiporter subunit D